METITVETDIITDDDVSVLVKYSNVTSIFLPVVLEYFPKAKINNLLVNRECMPVICIDKDRFEDEADFVIYSQDSIFEKNLTYYNLMIDDDDYSDYIIHGLPLDVFINDFRSYLQKLKEDNLK